MDLRAAYRANSGRVYLDDTHSGCLFAAEAAGESECIGFPFDDTLDIDDLETRMGFVVISSQMFLTREETLRQYGFDLAEDQFAS